MKRHWNIHIYGRVQGVGYRWAAAYEAKNIGISGFVKNMPDGSVYVEAEGSMEMLEQFLSWCKSGPARANVENLDFSEAGLKEFTDFNIS